MSLISSEMPIEAAMIVPKFEWTHHVSPEQYVFRYQSTREYLLCQSATYDQAFVLEYYTTCTGNDTVHWICWGKYMLIRYQYTKEYLLCQSTTYASNSCTRVLFYHAESQCTINNMQDSGPNCSRSWCTREYLLRQKAIYASNFVPEYYSICTVPEYIE
jgi:hypothetical protein